MDSRFRLHAYAIVPMRSLVVIACFVMAVPGALLADQQNTDRMLEQIGVRKGICAVLGLPQSDGADAVLRLARQSELLLYFQSSDSAQVAAVRDAAQAENLLGRRIFVDQGDLSTVHLASNLADAVIVYPSAVKSASRAELLRILHPQATAIVGDQQLSKPTPDGNDVWSHPYHGPDNNPQSTDQSARAPYLTQFLAQPKFCPMPEVSVAAGGRVFRAFGHIAHKENQNAWLNTLICANGYNGTILWKRTLNEGFMIHRNTLIATPEFLYLGDDQSCKRIDAASGNTIDEITIPPALAEGPVWKWMGMEGNVLYALIGGVEAPITTQPSRLKGLGHWPWGMWAGHDYKDPKTSFGYGRTLVAVRTDTKEILWNHREEDYIDSRGICMKDGRIYFFCPEKHLSCLDAESGDTVWQTTSPDLLQAIGPHTRAQHYVTGYATTTYIKCNDDRLFFAGPQRSRLVVASAADGRLLWQRENGNLQLVLREDGFYAAGPGQIGCKLSYDTGQILARLPSRRACTRATGSVDSVFFRTPGGTVRIRTASNTAAHIAPMRPPCQDGVIISDGLLYWGPWMCGCQLSLYGHICLAPAGDFDYHPGIDESRLERAGGDNSEVQALETRPGDWPAYCGNSQRTCSTSAAVPDQIQQRWKIQIGQGTIPTAPVTAGGLVFIGDTSGVVRAVDAASGVMRWQAYTGGAIYFPPAIWRGRVYAGSADGWVYALEAATGRLLWRFRCAPAERRIAVFGRLVSTWPVAGGVVVQDGTVYAAAGIAHYDGTYVYALDAITGEVRWANDRSGSLSEKMDCGISLQGSLCLRDGELRFLGGGVYETARFDVRTGRCLNQAHDVPNSTFRTAFYPYYPAYGKYNSLAHALDDGRSLIYDASYEGSLHGRLSMVPAGTPTTKKLEARWSMLRRRTPVGKTIWRDGSGRRFNGFAVSDTVVLAVGEQPTEGALRPFIAAIDLQDGRDIWRADLPATGVKGALAVDHDSRIFVAMENGQLMCLAEADN